MWLISFPILDTTVQWTELGAGGERAAAAKRARARPARYVSVCGREVATRDIVRP